MTVVEPEIRNGVDTRTLFDSFSVVKDHADLAHFRFRAANRWVGGTHSRGTIGGYERAGEERTRPRSWIFDTDHPLGLTGADNGPTPVEFVLLGVAGCLTANIATIAAARGITLRSVESVVEGDLDVRGTFGISPDARNGCDEIRVSFLIDSDASEDQLNEVVAQARARSAVLDMLSRPVAVSVSAQMRSK